jgi:hypothetical protein
MSKTTVFPKVIPYVKALVLACRARHRRANDPSQFRDR